MSTNRTRDKNRYRGIPRLADAREDVKALIEVVEVLVGARNDPMYRALTPADLVNSGYSFTPTGNGAPGTGLISGGGGSTGAAQDPIKPTNLMATGGFTGIALTWDNPNYIGHAYAEIYRSSSNDFGSAALIASVAGRSHTDVVEPGSAYYYWIRFVSVTGKSGPLNSTNGTLGTTSLLVTDIIQATNDLLEEDDLIPGIVAPPGGPLEGLAQEILDRIAGDEALEDDNLLQEIQLLATDSKNEATQLSLNAQIVAEQLVRADADSAMAQDILLLQASVDDPGTGLLVRASGLEQWQASAVADPDGTVLANSTRLAGVEAIVSNPSTGLEARATVLEEAQAIIEGHIAANYSLTTTVDDGGNVRVMGMKFLNQVGTESKVVFNTDVFAIAPPYSPGQDEPGEPVFVVGPVTIPDPQNPGQTITIQAPVMSSAFIGDLTVDSAKIREIAADKITVVGVPGNPSSIAEVLIGSADITNAMIADVIQSSVLDLGNGVGWRIDKNGGIDAAALTIRNNLGEVILSSGGTFHPDIDNSVITLLSLGFTGDSNANYITGTAELVDNGQLGLTADWSLVTGDNRPEDNATYNLITSNTGTPSGGSNGDIHYETDRGILWMKENGVWTERASLNQGEFAQLSGKITEGNIGDLIAAQAISGTYIKDLTVDTLKIKDNAVTVPSVGTGSGGGFSNGSWKLMASVVINWGSNRPAHVMAMGMGNALAGNGNDEATFSLSVSRQSGARAGVVGTSLAKEYSGGLATSYLWTGTLAQIETYKVWGKIDSLTPYTAGEASIVVMGAKK